MWADDLKINAEAYCEVHQLDLHNSLGNGADGNVWTVSGKQKRILWALKVHRSADAFEREAACYKRLSENGVFLIGGVFHVPLLLRADAKFLSLELTVVERPFILDFAQAYLDEPPQFDDRVWEERCQAWEEIYEGDWLVVRKALEYLASLGIYYLDVHRNNIAI